MNLISKPRIQTLIRQIFLSSFKICWLVRCILFQDPASIPAGHPVGLADMPNTWNLSAGLCDPLCLHLKTATFENTFSWTHLLIIQHSRLLRPTFLLQKIFPPWGTHLANLTSFSPLCLWLFPVHRVASAPHPLPPASTHDNSGWYLTSITGDILIQSLWLLPTEKK